TMFSVVNSAAQLNALPLGDGTFAQAKVWCDERKTAEEAHHCQFEISDEEATAPFRKTVSLAPGELVELGQLEKKNGAKIPLFVAAASNGGVPFVSVPSPPSISSHTIAVQVFSSA